MLQLSWRPTQVARSSCRWPSKTRGSRVLVQEWVEANRLSCRREELEKDSSGRPRIDEGFYRPELKSR